MVHAGVSPACPEAAIAALVHPGAAVGGSGVGLGWRAIAVAARGARRCPSPPPRSTPRCSTRAKGDALRVPRDQRLVLADPERRAEGLRGRGLRRHHPGLHRWRGVPLRSRRSRTWSPARSPSRRTPPRSPRTTRSTSRCTPTTAPRTSSTASSGRCSPSPRSGSAAARPRCSSRTCGTARPCRWTRTSSIAEELLERCIRAKIILEIEIGVVGGEEDGVENADQRQALHHPRGRHRDRRGAGATASTAATWPR